MRRALAAEFAALPGHRVIVTLDARLPDEPGPWQLVRVGPGEESVTLERLATAADYTLIIAPETEGILADRERAVRSAGACSLGSSPEAIALAGDKLRLSEHFLEHGIPTPPSRRILPAEGWPDDVFYPCVIKPIDGAGSIDTYFVAGPQCIPAGVKSLPEALLQPFVKGRPMSASFLVGAQGHVHLLGIGQQHIDIHESRFFYRGGALPADPCPPSAVLERAVRSVSGLRGFVGVDFLWETLTGEIHVLEINPRPTTSVVGLCQRLAPGRLAGAWLAAAEGRFELYAQELAREVHAQKPWRFRADGRNAEALPPG